MVQFLKKNLLPVLLSLCVLVSLGVLFARAGVESRNKTYDVILDYSELELLAQQSDEDISWWLEQFREIGITRVGLTEESLMTLMENSPLNVTTTMMDQILLDSDWRDNYPSIFVETVEQNGYDRYDVMVEVLGTDAITFVRNAIETRLHAENYHLYEDTSDNKLYILLDGTVKDTLYRSKYPYITDTGSGFTQRNEIVASKLMYLSLGLLPEKVEIIQSLGMEISPRTICYNGH
ncbi:MAG: hypothetical protein IJ955_00630, partial [Oscillospiraceae bacterium]|nr:hypothetical protein [Oscillospiraceae bacterium]